MKVQQIKDQQDAAPVEYFCSAYKAALVLHGSSEFVDIVFKDYKKKCKPGEIRKAHKLILPIATRIKEKHHG